MRRAARDAYDSYLKANRVERGIESYDAVVRLVLGSVFDESWTPRMRMRIGQGVGVQTSPDSAKVGLFRLVPALHRRRNMGAAAQLRVHSLPNSWRPVRLRASKRPPATFAVKPAPEASARAAGLRYTSDGKPGIQRRRSGSGFTYPTPDGRVLRDRSDLQRIKSLVIPPAWSDVWICPDPRGHLQATGRDARGRKQYRYHPRWREVRDETKYHSMIAFAYSLPAMRRRTNADLGDPASRRSKVLAPSCSCSRRPSSASATTSTRGPIVPSA